MKYLQLSYVCLVAVGLLVPCSSAQNGVCSKVKYRQGVASVTFAAYRNVPDNYRYSCGFLWLGRCRGTRTRQVSSQAYKHVTRVESVAEKFCCIGYTGSPPNCIITCPDLKNPSNGIVDYSSNVYQSEARYHCNLGYSLIGESSRICQSSGQWTTSQPSCQHITCSIPQHPMNGYVSYTSTRYNHVAYYICHNNYKLVGALTRTCTGSGQWSGAQPSCQRLQCPSLPSPENGNVSVNSNYPSGITTYNCHYGYKLVGLTPVRVCESEETWTGMAPSCQQIRCPAPTQPDNGTVNVTSNTVDGIALFYCLPTHDLDGSNRRVCTENGEWNGIQPQCSEKCTPFIGFNEPFLKIKEGESKTVCLKTCSCYFSSNLTLELKARSQDDALEKNTDLVLPSELIVNANSSCFEVTAVDDDLLEGFEAKLLLLYKPNGERYYICEDSAILPVSVVDNDELTIGFENFSINVPEAAGTMEVCVVVSAPEKTVHIPDVVVYVQTWFFGEAKQGEDYRSIDRLPLPLSHTNRRACFPITIIDDSDFEHNEEFSLLVERDSVVDLAVPLTLEPNQLTLKIMDDDGISLGFDNYERSVNEGSTDSVCIEARFPSPDIQSFFVLLNTRSLTAEEGSDYAGVNNFRVGPFAPAEPRKCFSLNIMDDALTERKEYFTLEISGEPNHVLVVQRTTLVTINYDVNDEPMPCDSPLRRIYAPLFKHCDDCEYPHECLNWEEKPDSRVEVPKKICSSKKMCVEHCTLNATSKGNCNAKEEFKSTCVLTTGQKLAFEIGAGNGVSTLPKTTPPKDATSSQSRSRRQTDGTHCYKPQDALSLNPQQCNAYSLQCPYSNNEIRSRDPKAPCTNRSVLFVLDSSHSIGYDLFKEVSESLSHLVGHLCGDVQFGLLKFSSAAYLEFCFDCYSNNERNKLRDRILNTEYLGHSSFTGYATRCANSFMFGESNSCGDHEGRCVDIVFITDGQSSDRAFINVCDQVECLHKNPLISDRLNIYALNIGTSALDEAQCITKYSPKLRDGSSPIFNFNSIDDLIIELNTVIRLISQDQQKHRESASKLVYQCKG